MFVSLIYNLIYIELYFIILLLYFRKFIQFPYITFIFFLFFFFEFDNFNWHFIKFAILIRTKFSNKSAIFYIHILHTYRLHINVCHCFIIIIISHFVPFRIIIMDDIL